MSFSILTNFWALRVTLWYVVRSANAHVRHVVRLNRCCWVTSMSEDLSEYLEQDIIGLILQYLYEKNYTEAAHKYDLVDLL